MAIVLEANYAKKLGLPGYSSHQYSVSIRTELTDLNNVAEESSRLYRLLQGAVDDSIQEVGFIPDPAQYGHQRNGNARSHPNGHHGDTANGHRGGAPRNGVGDRWSCTAGQQSFIQRIVAENNLDKQETEDLAVQLFGAGVKQLNRMQASQLIEELLAKAGKPRPARWQQQPTSLQPQPSDV